MVLGNASCRPEQRPIACVSPALALAPFPRRDDIARPDSTPRGPRLRFLVDVRLRVSPVRKGPALPDHPGVEVPSRDAACCHEPVVAVPISHFAHNALAADLARERLLRFTTARPVMAPQPARLPVLGSIDAVQTNLRTVYFKAVPINGPRPPRNVPAATVGSRTRTVPRRLRDLFNAVAAVYRDGFLRVGRRSPNAISGRAGPLRWGSRLNATVGARPSRPILLEHCGINGFINFSEPDGGPSPVHAEPVRHAFHDRVDHVLDYGDEPWRFITSVGPNRR